MNNIIKNSTLDKYKYMLKANGSCFLLILLCRLSALQEGNRQIFVPNSEKTNKVLYYIL